MRLAIRDYSRLLIPMVVAAADSFGALPTAYERRSFTCKRAERLLNPHKGTVTDYDRQRIAEAQARRERKAVKKGAE